MDRIWIVAFIIGGFVVIVLFLLLMRGRFGTPTEQGDFELHELVQSDAIPSKARRKSIATCRGHSLDSRQIIGAGVLWITDDTLGFLLRNPRRSFHIKRSTVISATVSDSFHRTGIEEFSDAEDFLIVEFYAGDVIASIVFQLPDPETWIKLLDRVSG